MALKKKTLDVNKALYSHDMEEAVLGALLLESESFKELAEEFNPNVFDKHLHNVVANAILELTSKNEPVDILTVTKKVHENGLLGDIGGAYSISALTNRVASSVNLQYHYKILQQKYIEREIVKISDLAKQRVFSYGYDIFETHDWFVKSVEDILKPIKSKTSVSHIHDVHLDYLVDMTNIIETGAPTGVKMHIRYMDNLTGGWKNGHMITIAARTSIGKSIFGIMAALNPAMIDNIPTALFSLEMTKQDVVNRVQSIISGMNSSKLSKKLLNKDEVAYLNANLDLSKIPMYIDDKPSMTLIEFRTKARKLVQEKGVKLIVLDYIQLMKGGGNYGTREQEVSDIARGVKEIAKELNVPIISLAQLNRGVEARGGDKKPALHDLRESGEIEMSSDMVILLYRPEYYGLQEYEFDGQFFPNVHGLFVNIIAKHRGGVLGEVYMRLIHDQTKLENWDFELTDRTITRKDTEKNNQNNFAHSNKNSTFVPDEKVTVINENTDFLSQGKIRKDDEEDVPF